jgi:hypothetical protein
MGLFTYKTSKHKSIYFLMEGSLSCIWSVWNLSLSSVFALMITVPIVATERASAKFVFTHFNNHNNAGIHNNLYIFVLGLLWANTHCQDTTRQHIWCIKIIK